MIITILYFAAAVVALGACIPQIYRLMQYKQADSFSVPTWLAWAATQVMTFIYVVSIRNYLMMAVSGAWVFFYLVMICLIVYYRRRRIAPDAAEQIA